MIRLHYHPVIFEMKSFFFSFLLAAASLSGFAQNASDNYLDMDNYATIGSVKPYARSSGKLANYYQVHETGGNVWVTMSLYGAFCGCHYDDHPQKWIKTTLSNSSGYFNSVTWNASDVYQGYSAYFSSSNNSKALYGNYSATGSRRVTFYVKNVSEVKLLGKNADAEIASGQATSLYVYDCTDNGDGTFTETTNEVHKSNRVKNASINLSCSDLDVNKIYKVEARVTRGWLYEIAFKKPVKYFPVTISQYGVSTLYVNVPLDIPYSTYSQLEGVYYVNAANGSEASVTKLNASIPAKTGVIVKGAEGTYNFREHVGSVAAVSGNLLSGSLVETTPAKALSDAGASATSIVMTLSPLGTDHVGFYKFIGSTLRANMAYLIYDVGGQGSVNSLSITGMGDESSGIGQVSIRREDGAWHTLQGVRLSVTPTQPGIYIHGGKKVVVK